MLGSPTMRDYVLHYLKEHLAQIGQDLGLDAISVYETGKREGRLLHHFGDPPRDSVPLGVTPLGECLKSAKICHQQRSNHKNEKYSSILTLPIGEKPLGAIQGASMNKEFFDPYRVGDLKNVASFLALVWLKETALA